MAKKEIQDLRSFSCGYCGFSFEQEIHFFNGIGRHNGSNQVKCPHCKNFLKNDEGVKT